MKAADNVAALDGRLTVQLTLLKQRPNFEAANAYGARKMKVAGRATLQNESS
jgi:hypothetical protein